MTMQTESSITLLDYERCPRADANNCPKGSWMVRTGSCDCPPVEELWWGKCSCGYETIPEADRKMARERARLHVKFWHKPGTVRTRTVRNNKRAAMTHPGGRNRDRA